MSTAAQPYPPALGVIEPEDAKDTMRTAIRSARQQRSERRRQEAAQAFADVLETMPELRAARCVAAYVARPFEPSTGPLLELLADRGVRVLLPVLGTGLQRDWAAYNGADDLQQRAPGRPREPGTAGLGAEALQSADVIVAPALAVDTSGARLGQGGGWYDRALEHARPGTPVIAMVFAEEVYDAGTRPLPRQPHDRLVDAVATPEGWRWLRLQTAE
ncbi:5-formyltetrahydrofolate cyclo-ligase [Pengzhenrongella frigida]|uniref:5-formyltetrahydrofolate cyclo-ligase n=1 Tax=Pengzhenrongella frigida TaxID=1259133 RepID=A0A4Q5MXK3_9MICO|nr:5-formyltetrahydrofolate cyclo-ligase [Cellulomonas sp. HLT2-17]RYV50388.1 5-formyltetrahydrofolate cyclo-ligase [Cellulomonas sp. HLT2-17]